jgi:hypothetical protein
VRGPFVTHRLREVEGGNQNTSPDSYGCDSDRPLANSGFMGRGVAITNSCLCGRAAGFDSALSHTELC